MEKYFICGINTMGSTWYLSDKNANECNLWSGAPKEMRAIFDNKEEAMKKVKQLDENFRFGTTRHYLCKV
jgi:hypothetical protein